MADKSAGGPSSSFALLRKGFRPFFLLAAAFAALMVPIWLLVLGGSIQLATSNALPPIYWHAHEMIFGFSVAIIAGFLLTAVANWTQRETAIGARLLGLLALWFLGRCAMAFPTLLFSQPPIAALIDLAFLPALIFVLARPLISARSADHYFASMAVAGCLWTLAFLLFVASHARILITPRIDGKAG